MARIVLIVDSATGELVDVAGNVRETARYAKFVRRLLSKDGKNLDYGINDNDTLIISKGGYKGETIKLLAKTVVVPENLTVDGKTVAEIASEQIEPVLDRIRGTEGEIAVDRVSNPDPEEGYDLIQISLDQSITGRLEQLENAVKEQGEGASEYIAKADLANALLGISIQDDDDLETVKAQFKALLANLSTLAGVESSSASSGSESSASSSSSPSEEP